MRVERSFAFVDICGFTGYTESRGDEEAVAVLASFRSAIREIASRRGVRVAKWLGDGAMIVSVEPQPLVCAVLEAEHRVDDGSSPLPIRVGLVSGPVLLFEGDDYIGSSVNLAARLCDAAAPRQVLAIPELAKSAPLWVEAIEEATRVVPGFPRPVEVVRLACRPPGVDPFLDPICSLLLPRDGVATVLLDSDGAEVGFCSDSCAQAWLGSNAGQATDF
jgi:adenylate cyclase